MTEIIHYRYRYPLKLFFRIQSKHGPEPAEYVCRFDGKIFTSITARRHVISAHPGRLEDMVIAGIVRKKSAKKGRSGEIQERGAQPHDTQGRDPETDRA